MDFKREDAETPWRGVGVGFMQPLGAHLPPFFGNPSRIFWVIDFARNSLTEIRKNKKLTVFKNHLFKKRKL